MLEMNLRSHFIVVQGDLDFLVLILFLALNAITLYGKSTLRN